VGALRRSTLEVSWLGCRRFGRVTRLSTPLLEGFETSFEGFERDPHPVRNSLKFRQILLESITLAAYRLELVPQSLGLAVATAGRRRNRVRGEVAKYKTQEQTENHSADEKRVAHDQTTAAM
jgi:hypothetical protein